ncbi:MAG TPA: hypothetical protein VLG92_01450 [Candidatus Saccharimonadia bacterium]|nr:hypothetical protein [Candidatus Saccharimonadia bacterium]
MNPDNTQQPAQTDPNTGTQPVVPSQPTPQGLNFGSPSIPQPTTFTPDAMGQTPQPSVFPVTDAATSIPQTTVPIVSANTASLKSRRVSTRRMFIAGIALVLLIGGVGLVFTLTHGKKSPQTNTSGKLPALIYNDAQIEKLAQNKQLTVSALTTINKTNAFYSAFRLAAQRPVVQTNWDVYNTASQAGARPAEYTISVMSVDYQSKEYTYYRDDYTSAGATLSRCAGGPTVTYHNVFDPVRSTATTKWWPNGDTVSCAFAAASARMTDGMNTGGLSSQQSDTFVHSLYASKALKVNSVSLVPHTGTEYLQFDVNLIPQRKTAAVPYSGMQNFMDAFKATGLNPSTYPYTNFGAGGEGMHLQYYVNPTTMLPAYSVAVSTPALDAQGKQVQPTSWSHRYVEYSYPSAVMQDVLDPTPQTFSSWPDH